MQSTYVNRRLGEGQAVEPPIPLRLGIYEIQFQTNQRMTTNGVMAIRSSLRQRTRPLDQRRIHQPGMDLDTYFQTPPLWHSTRVRRFPSCRSWPE